MIKYFKTLMQRRSLKAAQSLGARRAVRASNFETTQTMGVIFPVGADPDELLKRLKQTVKDYKIQMTYIIYLPQNKLPEGTRTLYSRIIFSDNECNWYGKPDMSEINDFIHEKFDMLLDLSMQRQFPLQYIVAASQAAFKIGCRCDKTSNPYDFLLVGSDSEQDFVTNLEKYLKNMEG
jgi:hypothetical protein